MEESIYGWIERERVPEEKKPMYHSKHDPKGEIFGSTFKSTKRGHGTFGTKMNGASQKDFLRSKHYKGVDPKSKRTYIRSSIIRTHA